MRSREPLVADDGLTHDVGIDEDGDVVELLSGKIRVTASTPEEARIKILAEFERRLRARGYSDEIVEAMLETIQLNNLGPESDS